MKSLCVKLVPYSFVFSVCLLLPFRVVLSEPVESNAPATPSANADSGRAIYDQRQTGKYNIHVSIKDVAIIEVDQNGIEDVGYDDDDYYYDEGQLTVKPLLLNPNTTQKQPNILSTTTLPTALSVTQQSPTLMNAGEKPANSTNQNLSPNLLADIAATHATNDDIDLLTLLNSSEKTIPVDVTKKGTQNVVILDTQSLTHNSPTSTHKPAMSSTMQPDEKNARSKEEAIQSILQGGLLRAFQTNNFKLPLRPYLRFSDANLDETSAGNHLKEQENNSKIYKFKVRRAQKQDPMAMKSQSASVAYPIPHLQTMPGRRCRRHQYRDASGDCRTKRSSSILKKLFSMLVTLPFPNERAIGDRDEE